MILARLLLALLILAAGWRASQQLRALHAFQSQSGVEGALEALRLDPTGPEYHYALGLYHRDQIEYRDLVAAQKYLATAASLNPHNWRYQLELARTYDISNLGDRAEKAYRKAIEINPRAGVYRWRLANFYIRNGSLEKALTELQSAVLLEPSYQQAALELLWKLGVDYKEIEGIWPTDKAARLLLIQFLTAKGEAPGSQVDDGLEQEWNALLARGNPTAEEGTSYLRYLVHHKKYARARDEWIRLLEMNGQRDPDFVGRKNLIWEGDFERPLTNGVFAWNMEVSEDFSIVRNTDPTTGSGILEITFLGRGNLNFRGLEQKVITLTEGQYSFSFRAKSKDVSTEQGIFFEILDDHSGMVLLETEMIRGATPWRRYGYVFRLPGKGQLLSVRLRRRPSRRIDNVLKGSIALDSVTLKSVPEERFQERKSPGETVSGM